MGPVLTEFLSGHKYAKHVEIDCCGGVEDAFRQQIMKRLVNKRQEEIEKLGWAFGASRQGL
jgi:hypothetical protein